MSYYEPQGWQAPVRQTSWEQPAPPSRSGTSLSRLAEGEGEMYGAAAHRGIAYAGTSSASQREETTAFASQFDGMRHPSNKTGNYLVASKP